MGALAQVLRELPAVSDPNLLVGSENFDDAAVYRLSSDTALVMTLDFFPPLVDDPYQFGRIAAANSLSDIYAMGARPLCALNIVGFPDKDLPIEVLGEILRGGAERVAAAGAVIAGGHSVRDTEIKYGLSVTGVVHPEKILANKGARPGDVLVLTKPLGSGTLTTAFKQEKIAEGDLDEAIDVMTELNAGACEAALEVGVHAATDITGFGLIGHVSELAQASGVTVELDAKSIPLLDQTLDLARSGVITRAAKSNLAHVGQQLACAGVDEVLIKILADAQTSGGLLLSVAADRADQLRSALRERNTRSADVIGRVLARANHWVQCV
jgi:selenide, water dikinase